jgi:hypothetical protein
MYHIVTKVAKHHRVNQSHFIPFSTDSQYFEGPTLDKYVTVINITIRVHHFVLHKENVFTSIIFLSCLSSLHSLMDRRPCQSCIFLSQANLVLGCNQSISWISLSYYLMTAYGRL